MRGLIYLFVFFCFFPYIDIINIGTDTQPNALLLSAVILFTVKNKRLNTAIVILWLLFFLTPFLAAFSDLSHFETLKNILNYLSAPMICFAAYTVFSKSGFRMPFKAFLLVVLTYMFVAYMQMYHDPKFGTLLLNEGARGVMLGGRGVVSLCPEPAFYGSICLFFIVFSLLQFSARQNLLTVPLLVIQLVFFSQSATSIISLLVALALFFLIQLFKLRLSYLLTSTVLVLLIAAFYSGLSKTYKESSAGILIEEIRQNPMLIATVDVSAGVRITSSISPYLSARHNYFLPMGWGTYKSFIRELHQSHRYPKLLNKYIVMQIGRLGGGINMILFHLGFLGLLFPAAIYVAFRKSLGSDKVMLAFIIFVVILFTQIQLMHSMIGFILAAAMVLPTSIIQSQTNRDNVNQL